jgi:transposase
MLEGESSPMLSALLNFSDRKIHSGQPFQFPWGIVKKTDPNDARNLALYLAKGLLPEVRMKEKEQAEVASLTQTRDRLVKLRTALKNKVNNLLSARGIELDKESLSSEKGLASVLDQKVEPLARLELEVIVEQIRSLNRSIARLERAIEEASRKLEGYPNLTSIKGIGSLGAGILLTVIGDGHDFAHEGKLAAYFGIVPRVQDSNETEHRGHITKRGSKLGRTALVQCALIAKRYSPYLHRFYERIRARRGTGKAIIALAAQVPQHYLSHPQKQLGVRRFPQFRPGGSQDLTTDPADWSRQTS